LTPEEAASKKLEEKDTKPPPYLSRALGIKEPPKKGKQSREEWRADLLNREKRVQERRHLSVYNLFPNKVKKRLKLIIVRDDVVEIGSNRYRKVTSMITTSCGIREERIMPHQKL